MHFRARDPEASRQDPILNRIPLSRPDITPADRRAVARVMRSDFLSLGPELPAFEREFARFAGTRHAVAVSSGTAALHVAMIACGIGPDDEVITTPFSFVASANAPLFVGARPVFVDIDPVTLNIDPAGIGNAVTRKTKAILPVHVFGLPCDMAPIIAIARQKKLVVIEDACEAIGATYRGKKVGTFGRCAVFAFYPNKQMTTGEGGMLVTDDTRVAELGRSLRNQGRGRSGAWLAHERLGYNYRLDEMSCALGRTQLARLPSMLKKRSAVAAEYRRLLADIPGLELLEAPPGMTRSWFVYVVLLPEGVSRARVQKGMAAAGIDTRPYFPPIHLLPMYRDLGCRRGDFPVTEAVSERTLALPFWTGMDRRTIDRTCRAFARSIARS